MRPSTNPKITALAGEMIFRVASGKLATSAAGAAPAAAKAPEGNSKTSKMLAIKALNAAAGPMKTLVDTEEDWQNGACADH